MERTNRPLQTLGSIDVNTLYTVDELAPLLRVSERTLRRYCGDRVFCSAVKVGKKWLVLGGDILSLFPSFQSAGTSIH